MDARRRNENAAARAGATASRATGQRKDGHRTRAANDEQEEPEHRNDRRRFLIWALMIGAVPPQRVTERVVAEVSEETT